MDRLSGEHRQSRATLKRFEGVLGLRVSCDRRKRADLQPLCTPREDIEKRGKHQMCQGCAALESPEHCQVSMLREALRLLDLHVFTPYSFHTMTANFGVSHSHSGWFLTSCCS